MKALAGLFGAGGAKPAPTSSGAAITSSSAAAPADPAVSTGTASSTDRVGIGLGGTKAPTADDRKRVPGLGL